MFKVVNFELELSNMFCSLIKVFSFFFNAGLLKDIPNPELLLSSTPISAVDLNLVSLYINHGLVLCPYSVYNNFVITKDNRVSAKLMSCD